MKQYWKNFFKRILLQNKFTQEFWREMNYRTRSNTHRVLLSIQNRGIIVEMHWLAIFYDSKGHADFFDSYGNPPSFFKLESFIERTSKSWSFNKIRIQGYSSFCGYYSLLYLLERARNTSHNFFSYFNKNYELNDVKIYNYLNLFKSKNENIINL